MVEITKLQFADLTFEVGAQGAILDDVNFDFPMNQIVWINGKGGSGKSTVLKLLAGLVQPQKGQYFINDMDVTDMSFEEFIPYRLRLGYAPDFGGLLSNRTLRENISLPVRYHKGDEYEEWRLWIDELIEGFGMGPYADQRPDAVTGAMRRAACVARALVLKPEVLLLDSPTAGLSRRQEKVLSDILVAGRENGWLKHIFMTSQNIEYIEHFNPMVVEIKDQGLTASNFCEVAA